MANNLDSNITDKLMSAFVPAFDSERKISKSISTNAKNLVNGFDESTGDSYGAVRMKRNLQFVPQRTADGDFTGKDTNPIQVGTAPAEVGEYCTVFIEMTDVERALESKDIAEEMRQLVAPAAEDMCNTIESELVQRMSEAATLASGDPSKSITTWDDIAKAGTLMKAIGLPAGSNYCAINTFDGLSISGEQKALSVNPEVGRAWDSATIANKFAGFDSVITHDNMPVFTSGTYSGDALTVKTAPNVTYAAAKDDYRQTIVITGGAAGETLTAGTTLIIGGVNLVHLRNHKSVRGQGGAFVPLTVSVIEDATFDGSKDATVKVSGCGIFETGVNGAYNTINAAITANAPVTVQEAAATEYAPALAWNQNFFGMGSIKLKKLAATDSSFTTKDGLNFRITEDSNSTANTHQLRIDFRPTFACLNPFFGQKVYGNS